MLLLSPAILTDSFEEFERQVRRLETLFSYAQIDIMDGTFVKTKSFSDVERVPEVKTGLQYELHLMVEKPYEEFLRWANANIRNITRVVFHAEAHSDPIAIIEEARARGIEVGVALNPETPVSAIESYVEQVDLVQFMTVHPGRQGAPFLPEMKDKITAFCARPHRPKVSVDGGINASTVRDVSSWGVEIANVGSYFSKAESVAAALAELRTVLEGI